jgi:hypothetical protein
MSRIHKIVIIAAIALAALVTVAAPRPAPASAAPAPPYTLTCTVINPSPTDASHAVVTFSWQHTKVSSVVFYLDLLDNASAPPGPYWRAQYPYYWAISTKASHGSITQEFDLGPTFGLWITAAGVNINGAAFTGTPQVTASGRDSYRSCGHHRCRSVSSSSRIR